MQKKIIVLALISAFAAPAANADTEKAELEKLRAMVQALDQKIRALEHKLESKTAAPVLAAKAATNVTATHDITVYGRVNIDFESVKNDKVSVATTAKSADRMQSNSSRFGVKGSEALGDNLAAIWQLEIQVDPANGGGIIGRKTIAYSNFVTTQVSRNRIKKHRYSWLKESAADADNREHGSPAQP